MSGSRGLPRALRIGGLILGAMLLLLALYLWFRPYHPLSAHFDPLIGAVRDASYSSLAGEADFKPCCFDVQQDKAGVLKRLSESEFTQKDLGLGYNGGFFGKKYANENRQIYSRSVDRFPCSETFFIALEFDKTDKLIRADGTWIHAICL